MTIWVHGPSAWDTVVEIEEFPKPGEFIRAIKKSERPGGSGLNVAMALATTGEEIGFITYLGSDAYGAQIKSLIANSGIKKIEIKDSKLPTLHALILKDGSGERTIIALEPTQMGELGISDIKFKSQDIFLFTIWRDEYKPLLTRLNSLGVICIVGAKALEDTDVKAEHVVGSKSDFKIIDLESAKARFDNIVITDGANGATMYSKDAEIHQNSLAKVVNDATGAGDSFLAGYALAVAKEMSDSQRLYLASAWSAEALASDSSLPPSWAVISDRWDFK